MRYKSRREIFCAPKIINFASTRRIGIRRVVRLAREERRGEVRASPDRTLNLTENFSARGLRKYRSIVRKTLRHYRAVHPVAFRASRDIGNYLRMDHKAPNDREMAGEAGGGGRRRNEGNSRMIPRTASRARAPLYYLPGKWRGWNSKWQEFGRSPSIVVVRVRSRGVVPRDRTWDTRRDFFDVRPKRKRD